MQSKIARLVICGNSLAAPSKEDEEKRMIKNKFGSLVLQYDPTPVNTLDEFLMSVCSGMDVDLMPGPNVSFE